MNVLQVVVGAVLLAISGLPFLGPSSIDAAVVSVVVGLAVLVGAVVVGRTLAREAVV